MTGLPVGYTLQIVCSIPRTRRTKTTGRKYVACTHGCGHPLHLLLLQVAHAYFKLLDMRFRTKARDDALSNPSIFSKQLLSCPDPFYPSSHIAQLPKEVKSIYLVQMPEHSQEVFTFPSNIKFMAITLLELYDNAVRYGPLLAAVPHLLSKYRFEIISTHSNLPLRCKQPPYPLLCKVVSHPLLRARANFSRLALSRLAVSS
ncbi:BZ3500_MvSof-1268-A1-R1_Chr1-3g01639 [Microbotryum saponariae]|uniref:BZ3500_MvSof-1268-A1-R1_Chr1-3g01639 protein n=1 Tax=Microbotryum saponariae TaxID=289078 RepID=A0A2X0KQ62_9BASI|nr:BZ3500_MvSof-1268-A1-R1_Chr1-3g01639 [Microbotryum saponariae]SCZ94208.1 BZ3501_MvSof-1269-A2-R1_Chr1-3g01240 [Microbotryum saponariae]